MFSMGGILFLLGFVIVEIQTTRTHHTSSEDINKTLDKLIQQVNDSNTKWNDEDSRSSEPEQDVPNKAEDKPGTSQSRSGSNRDEIELPQHKSAEIDKNYKLLEDLFEKDIKRKATTERSPYGRNLPKALSILHDYPEMVIDHITYNNDEDDPMAKEKFESQEFPDEQKNRHNEHTHSIVYQKIEHMSPLENIKSNTDLQLKNVKVHDSSNKISEYYSNKQNILLEKILEQLSVNRVQDIPKLQLRAFAYPGAVSPISNGGLGLMPTYSQNLQHGVVSTTYIQTPVLAYNLAPQVPIKPYLGGSLLGLSRPAALQGASLATNLFQRGMPRTNLFQRGMPLYRRNLAMLHG